MPLYGNEEPDPLAPPLTARAILGGDEYIDGYSIYSSPKGYRHAITYGMTELYADLKCFGKEHSGLGVELTAKYLIPTGVSQESINYWTCHGSWGSGSLGKLAGQVIREHAISTGRGKSLNEHIEDSVITALLFVNGTELADIDTRNGRVAFLLVGGITQAELEAIKDDPSKAPVPVENTKADNPNLAIDFSRTKNYL